MAKKIVLAGACRTAIGSMGGALSTTPAPELGSIVIKEALNRAGVAPEQVDHVYMGCVIQAGLGQNVARQASLKAGLPVETPATSLVFVATSFTSCAPIFSKGSSSSLTSFTVKLTNCSAKAFKSAIFV